MIVQLQKRGSRAAWRVRCGGCDKWKGNEVKVEDGKLRLILKALPNMDETVEVPGTYLCKDCGIGSVESSTKA